jgi:hypothetical protein
MKIIAALLVALSLSCAHVVPIVEDCSAEAAANLLDDVNTALATADYAGGLAVLVGKFGACVIEKTVREVAAKAGLRGQFDELEAVKAQRARDWLAARGKPVAGFCPMPGCAPARG